MRLLIFSSLMTAPSFHSGRQTAFDLLEVERPLYRWNTSAAPCMQICMNEAADMFQRSFVCSRTRRTRRMRQWRTPSRSSLGRMCTPGRTMRSTRSNVGGVGRGGRAGGWVGEWVTHDVQECLVEGMSKEQSTEKAREAASAATDEWENS